MLGHVLGVAALEALKKLKKRKITVYPELTL